MSDPAVMFLDEPTSGLDSLTAFIIVQYLRKLAREEGKNMIMTIHQPSAELFHLFDRLILMAEGQIVYQGQTRESLHYFSQMGFECPRFSNLSDYLVSILHQKNSENEKNHQKFVEAYELNLLS